MASTDQIKALLKSHLEGDDQRFYSVAMQLAAHEAELGHGMADELRALVGQAKARRGLSASEGDKAVPISRPRAELAGLITKYKGETAAKLRQVFEATDRTSGIYFFDEFDAIGSQRGLANDVGEIRLIINSFTQMI
jgi:hypothetical protein